MGYNRDMELEGLPPLVGVSPLRPVALLLCQWRVAGAPLGVLSESCSDQRRRRPVVMRDAAVIS